MRLVHVNLVASDPEASARFYLRWLMPKAKSVWLGDSLHLRDDGSDLAFQLGKASTAPSAHHGFLAASADEIDALAGRLIEDGIALTENSIEQDFRSIKFLDPDGYECEVYCEAGWP